ncbi:MAG: hypothetical protein P8Z33_06590 [Gammaproteobacteria bacterium]
MRKILSDTLGPHLGSTWRSIASIDQDHVETEKEAPSPPCFTTVRMLIDKKVLQYWTVCICKEIDMRLRYNIMVLLFLGVSLASCGGDNGEDLPDTEVPKWGNAILIESGSGTAYSPMVTFDSNDNAIAVWIQDDFADYSVFANTTIAGRWGTEEIIESRIFDAAQPWIAADSGGNAVAVWTHDDRDGPRNILANWYETGSDWQVEEQIDDKFGNILSPPRIAADNNGNALAVWGKSDGEISVYSNRYTAIDGWGTEETIESGDGAAYGPEIAMDSEGNAVAIWSQDDSDGVFSIYANRYIAGQGWQTEEQIESGSGTTRHDDDSVYLDVDMDATGNAIAVWSQEDEDGNFSVYANRYTPGEGWGNERIIESGTETATSVAVDMDSAGNAFAVWQQEDEGFDVSPVSSIYSNRYELVTGWGPAQLIESGDENAIHPDIQTDLNDNAIAVWIQGDTTGSIYSNRYVVNDDTGWGTENLLESSSGQVDPESPPSLAIDSEGNAVVVWAQEEFTGSGRYSVYTNRFE